MKKEQRHKALLEIGVEELPARFINPALDQLQNLTQKQLEEQGLQSGSIETFGTPRRLAVVIHDLPTKAADRVDVQVGPPPKAAKDQNGNWTKAATGFAKAQKISPDQLILETTAKGERFVAKKKIKGQKTDVLLKTIFPSLIQALNFPKSMIWQSDQFRFARPIRWIVSLFNTKVVNFRLAGVKSDRMTVGLLALGSQRIRIPSPIKYKSILQGRCIIADMQDRQSKIKSQLESTAKRVKAKPVMDQAHLEEVVNLTEYPTSLLGHFPESYLSLPREVLVSVLRKHQKFFPLENTKKKLINSFIGVRNGPSESQDVVRDGYERVLNARLADAKFFYDQDAKLSLESLGARLGEVGFHEKLGNLLDKTQRVKALVNEIGHLLNWDSTIVSNAEKAASLAKADLLTQMVGEFPELQGVAGRFYADAQGISSDISIAIEHHYWPLSADGKLPSSKESVLLSLADKLDTLAGNFYVGHAPTGSADPYALRRMATGVVRIVLENKLPLSIHQLLEKAFGFSDVYSENTDNRKKELFDFFRNRCHRLFEAQGFRIDEIEAVLSNLNQPLVSLANILKSLKVIRGKSEFPSLAAAIKRARNILRQAKEKQILPDQNGSLDWPDLNEESEKKLVLAIQDTKPKFDQALKEEKFEEALLLLAPLKAPVDSFFDGVMVMVDDEKVRSQRLRLLMSIERMFGSLADFSKLQSTPGSKKSS